MQVGLTAVTEEFRVLVHYLNVVAELVSMGRALRSPVFLPSVSSEQWVH